MCPIWCSSFVIDGPLLGFCVWSNISSLSGPSGNRIQTNKKSPQSLGLGVQMKKMISAEIVCICDRNQKLTELKLKPKTQKLTCLLILNRMSAHVHIKLLLFERLSFCPNFQQPRTDKKCSRKLNNLKTLSI